MGLAVLHIHSHFIHLRSAEHLFTPPLFSLLG